MHWSDKDSGVIIEKKGRYQISWILNPSPGAKVALLVNGKQQTINGGGYPFGTQIQIPGSEMMRASYLIEITQDYSLLQLQNIGETLLSLQDIPNTKIGNTSNLTEVNIVKM